MDELTYLRYSDRLSRQMQKIANLGRKIHAGFPAQASRCPDQDFVRDAVKALTSIGGRPGDGALEIYRDLDRDIQTARRFLEQWGHMSGRGYTPILRDVQALSHELGQLRSTVHEAGPQFMTRAQERIGAERQRGPKRYRAATDERFRPLVVSAVVGGLLWTLTGGSIHAYVISPDWQAMGNRTLGALVAWHPFFALLGMGVMFGLSVETAKFLGAALRSQLAVLLSPLFLGGSPERSKGFSLQHRYGASHPTRCFETRARVYFLGLCVGSSSLIQLLSRVSRFAAGERRGRGAAEQRAPAAAAGWRC